MAFADPLILDIVGDDNLEFNVVERKPTGTIFRTENGQYDFQVSHQYAKRTRRLARLDYNTISADPYHPEVNSPYSMSAQLIVDVPNFGLEVPTQLIVVKALLANMSASTYSLTTKMLEGQI